MNTVQNNEQRFYAELSATPPMPDCYTGVSRHIRQKKTVMRTLWAVAATLVLSVGLLPHHSATTPASQPAMVAAEVTEEINHVQTLFADDYSSTETASYSLVNNDSY
jgi:hypothetical protein